MDFASEGLLKNNNYLAEPVTFIVVPHRRYTLPFVSRNIYIEELDSENGGAIATTAAAGPPEVSFGDETHLLEDETRSNPSKDKFTQILNNVLSNLLRETKHGAARRGRVLRRKLGLQKRSKSTGYLPRDRFNLGCPCPCLKFKQMKNELSNRPSVQKFQKILKSQSRNVKEHMKVWSDRFERRSEKSGHLDENSALEERSFYSRTRANDNKCFVLRKLNGLKNDVVHLMSHNNKQKNKNGDGDIFERKSSCFYVGENERLIM